ERLSFFFSSRRRHTRFSRDWSSDVCSSDLAGRDRPGVRRHTGTHPADRVQDHVEVAPPVPLAGPAGLPGLAATEGAPTLRQAQRSEERRVGKERRYERWQGG